MKMSRNYEEDEDEYGGFIPVPTYYGFDENQSKSARRKRCLCKWCKITTITVVILLLLLFIIIFVVLPLIVMWSLSIQTYLMFPNYLDPSDPEYDNFQKYGAEGTRNFYVGVEDYYDNSRKIKLGVWHLVPESLIEKSKQSNFDYDEALMNSDHPVALYFHGNGGTRIFPLPTYLVLRKTFHVVAFDYRSYADSTEAQLSEPAVVNDAVQLYKWLKRKTQSKIYVWGHSLGSALSTHTVARLKDEGLVPSGLVLEAPFTTMKDEIPCHTLGRIFSWLPWFDVTIVEPLQKNGFIFNNTKNILKVDCPIMIMNAEDDTTIPYTFGQKLARIAREQRDLSYQGSVTYHLFSSELGYAHLRVTSDPRIPVYIDEFLNITKAYENNKRGLI